MIEYKGKYVTIMLCSQCNNNCKHCYAKYEGRFFDKELQDMIPALNKKYKVLLNGTEPILFSEYYKYFKLVHEHRILTNGIEIFKNPGILNELKKNEINEVWLSYHFEIQDNLSKIKTEQLNEVIKILKYNDFSIKLMCSLSTDNYKDIFHYCKKAIKIGANKIKFTNFISEGNAQNNYGQDTFLSQEQINYVLNEIEKIKKIIPMKELKIERCGTFGPNCNKVNFECLAGTNMVVITPDKKVYDCVFNISNDECIGYLDENNKIMIYDNKINYDTSHCKVLKKYNGIGK